MCMCQYGRHIQISRFQCTSERSIESQLPCTIHKPIKASDCTIPFYHLCDNFMLSFALIKVLKMSFILSQTVLMSIINKKQVAQRATIAHLSPMCQGQISFKKNMSLLPRNKLAWRHHFPIITLWNIFQTLKGH